MTTSNVAHAELGSLAAGALADAVTPPAAFYTNAACEALGELAWQAGKAYGNHLGRKSNEEFFGGSVDGGGVVGSGGNGSGIGRSQNGREAIFSDVEGDPELAN